MHPHEHRRVARHLAHHEGEVDAVVHGRLVGQRGELAEVGRQPRGGDPAHELLLARAVLDEIADRDHLQRVAPGQVGELSQPGHPTALVEHLADDAGRVAAGQPGEVHRRLGVAGAAEHAAFLGPQRKDVAGHGQVVGPHVGIDERADRHGAVIGRRAGGHPAARIDGDGEGGAHRRGVLGDHHAQLELVEPLAGHRHADQAAAVGRHEVDGLRRGLVGRHHEVALVLAVFVVDDQQDPAQADLLDALLDRSEHAHGVPRRASDRCRYLPITSVSMLTA